MTPSASWISSSCFAGFVLVAGGCGDAGGGAEASATQGTQGTTPGGPTTEPSDPTTAGPLPTTGDSGGATGTTAVEDSAGSSSAGETGFLFDVGTRADFSASCECGMASEFSYIWVANSPESTVSKIDTTTVQEVARYRTRADGQGNPSRTSVSISGRSVAVANRHGGLVKIWANAADCDPNTNGTPGLQTSSGAGDVLAWDQDDCVAWYTDFPEWTTQRPATGSTRRTRTRT